MSIRSLWCRITGSHQWGKRESDSGEGYLECQRCLRRQWPRGDEPPTNPFIRPGDTGGTGGVG